LVAAKLAASQEGLSSVSKYVMEPSRTDPSPELAQSISIIKISLLSAVKWLDKEMSDWFKRVYRFG
jgi:hypothetical protein